MIAAMNLDRDRNERPTTGNARRAPLLIALLYVAFAAGWILISGNLLTLSVDDPEVQNRIETIKGLLFVTVTGGLLYVLLRVWGRIAPDPNVAGLPRKSPSATRRLVPVAAALVLIGPGVGFGIVQIVGPQVEKDAFSDLQAIAALKTRHVESWLGERRADATSIATDRAFVERVVEWRRTGAERQRTLVYDRLESVRAAYGYEAIMLFDARGKPVMTVGAPHEIGDSTAADIERATAAGAVVLKTDLAPGKDGIHLDAVVSLTAGTASAPEFIGAVLLRVHPEDFLFPLIHEWPTASHSGETLLVRPNGPFISFVTDLRHDAVGAHAGKHPITDPDLPAAAALREKAVGTMRGVDYRGVPVLAAFRQIPGTEWRLIAKMDRDEILAPVDRAAFWIALAAFLAVSAVGAGMLVFWVQERRLHRLELQTQSDRLLANFYNLPFIGMAITSPETKRWVRFNDRLCDIFGYSREELATKLWAEMTHPDDLTADVAEFERVLRGESDGYAMDKRFIRKDGAVVFASIDVKCVRKIDGTVDYFVAMVQDVTERVRAMAELADHNVRLKAAFLGTVDLAMTLVGMRDPYTTGHERRAAGIAVGIGREMGFDQDRLEGIRIVAELHDIGNARVPLDILIKPSRLSTVEFEFIKTHTESAYEILKDVEFPWPVAEVALQHHERWDGSGYPNGLKGDAVSLEARIVAVADVVEAMASHRPYRPALGIDKALAEIESGRGTLYDPDVVDTCLRLFREKGYSIPD